MTHATPVRRIELRPGIVFEALVTAEGIGSWWGPDDVPTISAVSDPRVGGRFELRFGTADGRSTSAPASSSGSRSPIILS
jgi:uncharacterized protein YndB with AHSA1/START domain